MSNTKLNLATAARTGAWALLFVFNCTAQPESGAAQTFRTPAGIEERCLNGLRIPGGSYSASDERQEKEFCSIDFNSPAVALCPKTWSTSPATIVYDISGGRFAGDQARFEREVCGRGGSARREAVSELAMFKMSMNERDTSGTFSAASLLYYHLSRYFSTVVQVPVSVSRTIEKQAHERRVIEPGLRFTAGKGSLKQIHAGWRHYAEAVKNKKALASAGEFLTADEKQLYGVLLRESGVRYGTELNGTRSGGWGAGQNRAFQQTPPFVALRSQAPLKEAIGDALRRGLADPAFGKTIRAGVSEAQMVFWMRELIEVVLLDFILGQQDRVGNIDYEERWYWVRDGKVEERAAAGRKTPEDLQPYKPLRIRRSWLNDNDAGVRTSYSDFAEQTHMLDGIAHFSETTYRRLMRLDADLLSRGELHRHLQGSYGLAERELALISRRTREAAQLLERACREQRLRFDLEPREFLRTGQAPESRVDCGAR